MSEINDMFFVKSSLFLLNQPQIMIKTPTLTFPKALAKSLHSCQSERTKQI